MNYEASHKNKISKIRVIVRKRPANHREFAQNDIDIIGTEGKNIIVVKELKNKVDLTKYIEEHRYTFDRAYNETSTNQQIYEEILEPMIKAAFNKTKITCFAYGQTGSGKTYTMMGVNNSNNENGQPIPGLYLLSCIDLFKYLKKKEYSSLEIWVSFYEIYCNKLFDLLNNKNVLQAREDGKGNICIAGLVEKNTKNLNELMAIINHGLNVRTVGITGANLDSSRSHAILQIAIKTSDKEPYSKISFIDLAGSERAVDTIDTNKQNKIDGAEINKSLLALKECIRALDMEKRHKPFRGSKLTLVLRDSFIGNCLTLMIANISPCLSCSLHTLNTLRYADRVKELRKPRHEREKERETEYYNDKKGQKKEKDILADLMNAPKNNDQNVKYKIELKRSVTNQPNNLIMDHNYNFLKIKANKNVNILDMDKDIQKPDKNIMKIDDIIKNGKIPNKFEFKKNKRNSSENKKNQATFNNIINNYINNDVDNNDINSNYIINKENGINNIEMRNNNDKYNNYKKEPEYYNKNEIDEFNIDNYVSKYANVEIKDDEDYRQLSSIHEELINNILKEEDVFISQHKTHIDNMVESIKDEMKFLHEVDKPGSDIEEYTTNLDKLLVNEIKKITELRTRLNKFRIMLKDEEVLANIFDDEIILSPEDNKKNFEQSQDQDSLNIEDLGNEGIPNKPKFKFEKK
jgi:kinesin family protein 2/24